MPTRSNGQGVRARPATYGGVFMVTLTVLMYEIALTRIFSMTMWFHFAFVAISVSLFGLTAGALLVHLVPQSFTDDKVRRQLWRFSLAYAVAIAVAFVAQLAVPFKVELSATGIISLLWTPLVIAVPFTFAGVVVALALTRFPAQVNRVYAADLVGAGAGALVLLVALDHLDGPSVIILVAGLAAGGALLFALDAAERRGRMLAAGATVLLLIGAVGHDMLADRDQGFVRILRGNDGRPDDQRADAPRLVDRWNAFSRITVDGFPDRELPAAGNGVSANAPVDELTNRQLSLLIDGTAGTGLIGWDGDPDSLGFLRYDVSNLGYHALQGDDFRAAVVGAGGGRDVLSALAFGAGRVDGIEINGDVLDVVNDTFGDFTGHLDRHPRVNFHVDEARSFLTRADQRYDMIQVSLVDTFAATSSGAFALSESSLYTTEAWNVFLDRLEPGGILSVTRWFGDSSDPSFQPLEIVRATVLAAEVLDQRGAEHPREHILVYKGPPNGFGASVATVLVSPEPFTPEVRQKLGDVAGEMAFDPVLTADQSPDPRFAAITGPAGPGPALDQFAADVSAPTDDRPFFFQMADLRTLLTGEPFSAGADERIFGPVSVLGGLALAVLLIATVALGGPLLHMRQRISDHRRRMPHYLYFAGIGLGFMFVEIAQLVRLSGFLGQPTFALAVVLFTVLLGSGLGSMLVGRVIDLSRPRRLLVPLLALLGVVLATGTATPDVVASYADATTPARIAVAVGLLVPMSLLMGMPMAIGMRTASAEPDAPTAFLWGINGAMSVVATVFATVVAVFFGITMTLLAGWVAYALAAACLFVVVRRLIGVGADEGDGADTDTTTDAVAVAPGTNGHDGADRSDGRQPAQPEPIGV